MPYRRYRAQPPCRLSRYSLGLGCRPKRIFVEQTPGNMQGAKYIVARVGSLHQFCMLWHPDAPMSSLRGYLGKVYRAHRHVFGQSFRARWYTYI